MIKSYKDLLAWQKSMDLVALVYEMTSQFPREELFGLSTSLRRAAVAVPSKIASGHEAGDTREYLRLPGSARASLREVETQMEVARRLDYIDDQPLEGFTKTASDSGKIINGLMNSMERYAAVR